jgi:hypothetical protein
MKALGFQHVNVGFIYIFATPCSTRIYQVPPGGAATAEVYVGSARPKKYNILGDSYAIHKLDGI